MLCWQSCAPSSVPGAWGQARGKGQRPHPGSEGGRKGVPKPGPRSVPPHKSSLPQAGQDVVAAARGWAGCGGGGS